MGLITLKDIGIDSPGHNCMRVLLRAEAIKWIKQKNTGGFTFSIGFDGKVVKHNRTKENMLEIDWANLGAMIEMINFFNIIEEDLK